MRRRASLKTQNGRRQPEDDNEEPAQVAGEDPGIRVEEGFSDHRQRPVSKKNLAEDIPEGERRTDDDGDDDDRDREGGEPLSHP